METDLTQFDLFPKTYCRYVDDIFCVMQADKIEDFLKLLNAQHPSVQFTCEREINGSLPFLDLRITRMDNALDFNIYRKPTSTDCFIPADSSHNQHHKFAAFNSMVHRLLYVPLSPENYSKEVENIERIAIRNGFDKNIISRMIINRRRRMEVREASTLTRSLEDVLKQRIVLSFNKVINRELQKSLNKNDVGIINKNKNKLRTLLRSPKDKIPALHQSGIYQIKCNDCNLVYIGQSRRRVTSRFSEHSAATRLKHNTKSAVAYHMNTNGHKFGLENFKLMERVQDVRQLDAMESYFMSRTTNLMNIDEAPINSFLFID